MPKTVSPKRKEAVPPGRKPPPQKIRPKIIRLCRQVEQAPIDPIPSSFQRTVHPRPKRDFGRIVLTGVRLAGCSASLRRRNTPRSMTPTAAGCRCSIGHPISAPMAVWFPYAALLTMTVRTSWDSQPPVPGGSSFATTQVPVLCRSGGDSLSYLEGRFTTETLGQLCVSDRRKGGPSRRDPSASASLSSFAR